MFLPNIKNYIEEAILHFDEISAERKTVLAQISTYVTEKLNANEKPELIYICTHNSRRSHFGQIWAKTAADFYGFETVETYSGGTEATAFNPNAIKAAIAAGFEISKKEEATNSIYNVVYDPEKEGIICFSKRYDDSSNPQKGFAAVMTCNSADEACPVIFGAAARISTQYLDPKAFDGTPQQDEKYSERCRQIAIECLYVFSQVKK